MLFLIEAAIVLVFPAWAVRVWKRSGARGLSRLTTGARCVLASAVLVLAAEAAGNRVAASEGHWTAAGRLPAVAMPAATTPIPAIPAVLPAAAPRVDPRLLYPIAVTAALVAVVIGALAARYALV